MAQAIPVITAVVGVISAASTIYSVVQQKEAADEARDIAEQNAARQLAEAEESARRKEKQHARTQSLARARAFASGVGGVSQEMYLEDLMTTHKEEVDWIRKSGQSQAQITLSEGKLAQSTGYAGSIETLGSGIGQQYDWWTTYG